MFNSIAVKYESGQRGYLADQKRSDLTHLPQLQAPERAHFTDTDLFELLKKSAEEQTSGVIWIWSPRMILSYKGEQELRPISLLLQLDVTYLV
ncbi:MAG: hypothetical protein ACK5W9_05525, partial [Bdellovibrionales bacterium]